MPFRQFLPYGALLQEHGTQFVVFSRSATGMKVLLYDNVVDENPVDVIEFDSPSDQQEGIWSVFGPGLQQGQLYHFQAEGPFNPEQGHRFEGNARLIDPYAKALAGTLHQAADGTLIPPKCVVIDDFFEWGSDRPLAIPLADTVIYEMHVGGFTKHP
ncbi:MAG: glycogen debranching enzyme, partial [Planctomycetota bacterium]|nr:glycogen debranching enzyme [Planctomycetota bacterium]